MTYVLASGLQVDVPAGSCTLVAGPADVGSGTMYYDIEDAAPGSDIIESVILPDSFYLQYYCGFNPTTQTLVDQTIQGSGTNTGPMVADSYDFLVICHNPTPDCQFTLTWTATY